MLQAVIGFVGDGVGCLADTIGSLLLLAVAVAKELGSMATGPITVGEIATLNHEVIDNSVEDRVVVIAVFHEEFEILDVDGGITWIKFDRHRSGVCSAVPTQFKFHDVRGGVGSVGDVDHGQHQHTGKEDGDDTCWGRRTIVEKTGERRLANALVLHFVEQIVVQPVRLFVSRIFLGGFSKQRCRSAIP